MISLGLLAVLLVGSGVLLVRVMVVGNTRGGGWGVTVMSSRVGNLGRGMVLMFMMTRWVYMSMCCVGLMAGTFDSNVTSE